MSILKKIAAILTACIISMTIAVGCGDKEKDKSKEENKTVATEMIEDDNKDSKKETEKKTENDINDNDSDSDYVDISDNDVVGKWYTSKILAEGIELSAEACKNITGSELNMSIEFTADGMAIITTDDGTDEIPYDTDSDVLLEKDGSNITYDAADDSVVFYDANSGMEIIFKREGYVNTDTDKESSYNLDDIDNWNGGDVDLSDIAGVWEWVVIEAEGMTIGAEDYVALTGQEMSMELEFTVDGEITVIANGDTTTEACSPEGNLIYEDGTSVIKYSESEDIMVFEDNMTGMTIIFERK